VYDRCGGTLALAVERNRGNMMLRRNMTRDGAAGDRLRSAAGHLGTTKGRVLLYPIYELNHAIMTPYRAAADLTRLYYKNPLNPLSHTPFGKQMVAGAEVFERLTRRYGKPAFDIDRTVVGGREVAVTEEVTWERPFGRIVHFDKRMPRRGNQPNVLIVAPMSGHY